MGGRLPNGHSCVLDGRIKMCCQRGHSIHREPEATGLEMQ